MTTYEIKCAACEVQLLKEEGVGEVYCPKCGLRETHDNLMRELVAYTTDQMGAEMSRTFQRTFYGWKRIKFVDIPRTRQAHRFQGVEDRYVEGSSRPRMRHNKASPSVEPPVREILAVLK